MTEVSINGWRIYLHPLFLDQQNRMIEEVRKARAVDPENFESKRCTKILRAMRKVAFREIPNDPFDPQFRQGTTLGEDYKHWFRAKFLQQYRLFFRFSEREKIIILAWVNDEDTKRAYESKNDAYRTFRKMLDRGHPPDDWATLLKEARAASSTLNHDI
ncbi:type II toxin-antitoxin system YhaV family toxin [Rhizobium sp. TH2]|uniref:type II toxin-antitoxin system YhaV family toxin n=1 Tax=Rhizobium sp. TH2 TaxID=2775403 RepID=UPI00215809CA|nr:type II toxin-antitoxin system YhaV family toxin [Rhizobium sp. TH2]UVC07540.1 type II toxin-antitoxin system YhaV family toxin [Rhizobium sp. TH2]